MNAIWIYRQELRNFMNKPAHGEVENNMFDEFEKKIFSEKKYLPKILLNGSET